MLCFCLFFFLLVKTIWCDILNGYPLPVVSGLLKSSINLLVRVIASTVCQVHRESLYFDWNTLDMKFLIPSLVYIYLLVFIYHRVSYLKQCWDSPLPPLLFTWTSVPLSWLTESSVRTTLYGFRVGLPSVRSTCQKMEEQMSLFPLEIDFWQTPFVIWQIYITSRWYQN